MLKNKIMYALVEISQMLHRLGFTYKETDELISLMQNHYREMRDSIEIKYNPDNKSLVRSQSADDEIVEIINHVDPYF